jgi:hypothetical protein
MGNRDRQHQLDVLRLREAQGTLTDAERAELEALFAELDAEEAEAMRPAQERMQGRQAELQRERDQLAAEAAQLERVIRDQEQLVADARVHRRRDRSRKPILPPWLTRQSANKLCRPTPQRESLLAEESLRHRPTVP